MFSGHKPERNKPALASVFIFEVIQKSLMEMHYS